MGAPAALAPPGDLESSRRPVGATSPLGRHPAPRARTAGWVVSRNAVERRHRRHNGRARTIGQLCCSIARKRVRYLVRRMVGERSSREAGLRYSAGRALRGCGRSIDQGAVRRHAIERGPAALADRAEARGFGRRASAKQARGLRDLRRRLILLADRRTADADSNSNNQPNKQTYPVAAGKPARGTPKAEDLRDFWGEEVCLRVVPTVGIAVGTPVGIFLGGVGSIVGTPVGTSVGTRPCGNSGGEKANDPLLDLGTRPAEALAADLDQAL